MRTRDLIEALQKADPSGETPVVVDNKEVYTVERIEAFWDGVSQLHVVDESAKPYWHIASMRVTTRGSKVRLSTIGVEDFIDNFPDGRVEIDFTYSDPAQRAERIQVWENRIAAWRAETKRINAELEAEGRLKIDPVVTAGREPSGAK
jgi:hypothetical protein